MRFGKISVSAMCAMLLTSAPAGAAESVYTDVDVDLDHCVTLSKPADDEPGDFISLKCKGLGDYPLYFKESDLRQSAYFGKLSKKVIDGAGETFSAFNHIGKKVEWRLGEDGEPYAAILRWFIENTDPATGATDKAAQGQVLVVSKVATEQDPRGCVIGYIDALANPDSNNLARDVADTIAAGFQCGVDKPQFHGVKGEKSGEPAYSYPAP